MNIFQLSIKLWKCRIGSKNCEYYDTVVINNLCKLVGDKNAMWHPYLQAITPEITCPIKKVILR